MPPVQAPGPEEARGRILSAAFSAFALRGIHAVGIDDIARDAKVARTTFDRHFPSKDALVLALLEQGEQLWLLDSILALARQRETSSEKRLLAIFDIFQEWFGRGGFDADSFIGMLIEVGAEDPAGRDAIGHLAGIGEQIRMLARGAGMEDVDEFGHAWFILMKGTISSALAGDTQAPILGRALAGRLITEHRRSTTRRH